MNNNSLEKQEIFGRVKKILSEILASKTETDQKHPLTLTWDSDIFDDLGLDSLESLDLLTGLEEEFGVNPDQYEAVDKKKISQIVDYVIELCEAKKI